MQQGDLSYSWKRGSLLAGGLLLFVFALVLPAQEGRKKQPIPGEAEQARARKLILDIFAEDLEKAKTDEAKTKLAEYLFGQGRESTDNAANRYLLYIYTRDLAAQAGDVRLALRAVDELDKQFAIDPLAMKAKTLTQLADAVESPAANRELTDLALQLISRAIDDDNYSAAQTLGKVAYNAAKRAKNVKLVVTVQKRNKEVEKLQEGFAKLKVYLDRLKKNPQDAEANLEMGKYFGLLKNRWNKALPMLARGSDANLKALAKKDLQNPRKTAARVALADGWWELARQYKEPYQLHLQQRAAFWYDKAASDLAGLNRTKAIRRMDQVAGRAQEPITSVTLGPTGKIRELVGHTQEVKSIDFSPDGRHAVSGGVDATVRLWDLKTGKELHCITEHTKQVWGVAFRPGGRQFASASWDSTARLWDVRTGKEVRRYKHPVDVNGVAFSRDGRYMLVGCDDKFMQLWEVDTGKPLHRFTGPTRFVYGVAFSPDGRYVACGSLDETARVYDRAGKQLKVFDKHNNAVYVVAFSRDGRYLFTCGDNAVHQWEIDSGREIRRFASPSGSYITAMALSADGRRLLTGSDDKMVRLWDVATGKEIRSFAGHTDPVSAVAISADGRYALSGGLDRKIILWGLPVR